MWENLLFESEVATFVNESCNGITRQELFCIL